MQWQRKKRCIERKEKEIENETKVVVRGIVGETEGEKGKKRKWENCDKLWERESKKMSLIEIVSVRAK